MLSRVAGKRPAGIGGESKKDQVSLLEVVPSVGKWKKKETKRHNDGRGANGRVQTEMQMQLQIGCSLIGL